MEKIKHLFIAQFVCLLIWFGVDALLPNFAHAQPQNDAQGMLSLNLNKQVSKAISLSFMQQYLWGENYTELTSAAYQLGIEYQLAKGIKMSAAYRLTNSRNLANFYEQRQRFYADISAARKFGRFTLSLREAFQQQYRGWDLEDNPFRVVKYLRSRLQLRYSHNWYLTPYVSGEIYTQLYRPDRLPLSRINVRAGASYRFDVHNTLDLGLFLQKNVNSLNARTNYISVLAYSYNF